MTAYYWMSFYLDPVRLGFAELINSASRALVNAGCRFKNVRIPKVEDFSLPPSKWRYSFERRTVTLEEAERMTALDLHDRNIGSAHHSKLPVTMYYVLDFQFDQDLWKSIVENPKISDKEEVKEVHLDFWHDEDPVIGRRITIRVTPWEEYVLMYGRHETHHRNKLRIVRLAEQIYKDARPYFGWMDGELMSNDESFAQLLRKELPIGNEFSIIGPRMMSYLDFAKLQRSPYAWKTLPDGGVMIQNFLRESMPGQRAI
jgi:hypothetical protein